MDELFSDVNKLYQRIKPALTSKKKELLHLGIVGVQEEVIWSYLVRNKWKMATNLSLAEMINDIFCLTPDQFESSVKSNEIDIL